MVASRLLGLKPFNACSYLILVHHQRTAKNTSIHLAATHDWIFEIRDLIEEDRAAIEAKDKVLCPL
jgi:hypothetical protein